MHHSSKVTIGLILRTFFMALIVFLTLYPFIYMIAVSLSESIYVMKNEIWFYPKGLNFKMYGLVLKDERIFTSYRNTIVYVILGTSLSLILTSLSAYALSKKDRLVFASFFNIMMLFTMFFSGGMIPLYLNVRDLGIYDTLWAVILPPAISAWNLIIMRTFFSVYPVEIEESGRLEGLNDFGIFMFLVLPTSGAIMATIGLFYAVGLWNSFMGPFLYLKSQSKYPLQIVLREIVLQGSNFNNDVVSVGDEIVREDSLKYATIIISVIPIIAVYPFIQKYFVKGVMIGAIKG